MALFRYLATFDESLAMMRDLLARGFRVIPDRLYDGPTAREHEAVTPELEALFEKGPAFYLTGPFTKFPPVLRRLDAGPAEGEWAVNLLAQGPLLQGVLARVRVVDGVRRALAGDICKPRSTKHPVTGEWEATSPELEAGYRRAVATLKRHLVKDPVAKMPIGPAVLALIRSGEVRIGPI